MAKHGGGPAAVRQRFLTEAGEELIRLEAGLADLPHEQRRTFAQSLLCRAIALRCLGHPPTTVADRARIPAQATGRLLGPDGLLTRYSFRLEDTDADGTDDTVDPSILASVVEEFAPDRTRTGTYYTPRPLVSFMCREALRAFLGQAIEIPASVLADLIDHGSSAGIDPRARAAITAALTEVRALDPACGAGAFLVGFARELMRLHALLNPTADAKRSRRRLCRSIRISVCGTDVDPLAAEVARLRLELLLTGGGRDFAATHSRIVAGDALLGPNPQSSGGAAAEGGDGLAWRRAFGDVFERENGGFDLVLSNPPYVRHESLPSPLKRRLLAEYGEAAEGKSDLSVYFYARGLQLLRQGGVQVYVCGNSWLDAGYGGRLQAYLLAHGHVEAVYESTSARSFAAADVNTIVTVVRRGVPAADAMTRFIRLDGRHETGPGARHETLVSRSLLQGSGGRSARLPQRRTAAKWGGQFLRAPDSFRRILDSRFPLVRLGESPHWRIGRGRRTGWDDFFYLTRAEADARGIEPRFLRPLAKSPAEFRDRGPATSRLADPWLVLLCDASKEALRGTTVLRYITHGESLGVPSRRTAARGGRWYDLGPQPVADLLLPIAFHERFFVVDNDARAEAHQRFATLTLAPGSRHLRDALLALLTSSLVPLMAEVFGRRGLGQGALDLPPDDWRQIPIPDPAALTPVEAEMLAGVWRRTAEKPPVPLRIAVADPARRELDRAVFDLLGLSETDRRCLHEDVLRLVGDRLRKARAPVP